MASGELAKRLMSGSGSPTHPSLSSPALPAINNHILAKHIHRVYNVEQQLLEQALQCRQVPRSLVEDPATVDQEDDAPLPSNRYTHMADMLQPDNAPETFQAWKAQMQQLVQLRLLQVQQASSK